MKRKSILLIEDDAIVRDVIKQFLQEEYDVIEASKCSEAPDLLKNCIDLIIVDYVLPDGNGFELIEAIRKDKPELPAILMTGYSHETVVIKALRAGMTDYMKKPLNLPYLMKRLSELLGGKESDRYFEAVESREEFIIDGIAAYIENNYTEDLTLNKLAEKSCMNKFKFCRAFKDRLGRSSTSYINSIRIMNAAELMKTSDLNITEIAYFVGYQSLTHFERIFRTVYKMSPREYRHKAKQEE